MAADSVEQNATFKEKLQLPFSLLSDPQLQTVDELGACISRYHPMSLSYPKKAFLQPSVFFFDKQGAVVFQWIQTAKLTNFYGAKDRMEPSDIIAKAQELLAG